MIAVSNSKQIDEIVEIRNKPDFIQMIHIYNLKLSF
jgi:hypothetical protein